MIEWPWIVVYTENSEDELHSVGPFATALQAVLFEQKFTRENPFGYVTKVCQLEAPHRFQRPAKPSIGQASGPA